MTGRQPNGRTHLKYAYNDFYSTVARPGHGNKDGVKLPLKGVSQQEGTCKMPQLSLIIASVLQLILFLECVLVELAENNHIQLHILV